MSTDYIVKRGRIPENLTIGSREPVQTGLGTAPRVGTSLCTSVRGNTHWTIRPPICHSVPSESRRTHAPSPAPREKRKAPVLARSPLSMAHPCITSALPGLYASCGGTDTPASTSLGSPHPSPPPAPGLQAAAHRSRNYSPIFESDHTHLPV